MFEASIDPSEACDVGWLSDEARRPKVGFVERAYPGSNEGVHFVDEEDDLALEVVHVLEH
jgi:hypothetical protein